MAQASEDQVVYFIEDPDTKLIKVGCTAHLKQRLSALRSWAKQPKLHVLATFPGGFNDERTMHDALTAAGTRFHGEWFEPSTTMDLLINLAKHVQGQPTDYFGQPYPVKWTPEATEYWGDWMELL